jgi:hypothetical protein
MTEPVPLMDGFRRVYFRSLNQQIKIRNYVKEAGTGTHSRKTTDVTYVSCRKNIATEWATKK